MFDIKGIRTFATSAKDLDKAVGREKGDILNLT
jgi:hypothetical protein